MVNTVISSLLKKYFKPIQRVLRVVRNTLPMSTAVSSHYVALRADELDTESQRLRSAWQDEALPQRQRKLVDRQLSQYTAGARIDVFDVFVRSLRELPALSPGMSLLEIGCSSGYYSEVMKIAGLQLKYSGCDYSADFIRLAREKYPAIEFSIEDATALQYPDHSFDIVVSGGCLLHIPDYPKAVTETARVARCYAIFHRTPVVWGQQEQWYRKQAYGIETIEIHFNESDFLNLLRRNDLNLIATYTLSEVITDTSGRRGQATRTYVCEKKN